MLLFPGIFLDPDGHGGGNGGDGDGDDDDSNVPFHKHPRWQQMVSERKQLRERVAELEPFESQVAELTNSLSEKESQWEAERSSWAQERALRSAGLNSKDGEGRTVAMALYNSLPEEGRPELAEWVQGWADDPNNAPAGVRAYLEAAGRSGGGSDTDTDTGGGGGGGGADDDEDVDTDTGANRGGGGDAGAVTADQIRAAKEKAKKSGDWGPFDKLVDAYQAQAKRRG